MTLAIRLLGEEASQPIDG